MSRGLRWNALLRIGRQEFRDTLLGWGPFLTLSAGLLVAVLLLYNSVRFVGESGLGIIGRPYFTALLAATGLALLYVTVNATLAIARPREQGALQLLFFAPVDATALIGAYYLAGMATYTLLLVGLVPLLLLLGWLVNLAPPGLLLWGLVPTILVAGLAVAFGLFLSAAAPSGRSAVLLLVAATLVVLAIQGGHRALIGLPPTSRYYDALTFLRELLRSLDALLLWGSPFGLLNHGLAAALRRDAPALLESTLRALGGTVLWLALAVAAIRRRGVLP